MGSFVVDLKVWGRLRACKFDRREKRNTLLWEAQREHERSNKYHIYKFHKTDSTLISIQRAGAELEHAIFDTLEHMRVPSCVCLGALYMARIGRPNLFSLPTQT